MIDKDGKSKERYLFLFKARILVCKVRRISEDRSVFVLKDIIRVSECFFFQSKILLYHPIQKIFSPLYLNISLPTSSRAPINYQKKTPYFAEETILLFTNPISLISVARGGGERPSGRHTLFRITQSS